MTNKLKLNQNLLVHFTLPAPDNAAVQWCLRCLPVDRQEMLLARSPGKNKQKPKNKKLKQSPLQKYLGAAIFVYFMLYCTMAVLYGSLYPVQVCDELLHNCSAAPDFKHCLSLSWCFSQLQRDNEHLPQANEFIAWGDFQDPFCSIAK